MTPASSYYSAGINFIIVFDWCHGLRQGDRSPLKGPVETSLSCTQHEVPCMTVDVVFVVIQVALVCRDDLIVGSTRGIQDHDSYYTRV